MCGGHRWSALRRNLALVGVVDGGLDMRRALDVRASVCATCGFVRLRATAPPR
jgi:hypothetical protein